MMVVMSPFDLSEEDEDWPVRSTEDEEEEESSDNELFLSVSSSPPTD